MDPKHFVLAIVAALTAFLFTGCQSGNTNSSTNKVSAAPAAVSTAATPSAASASEMQPIRIKAGSPTGYTNAAGVVWLPDQGFADGDTTDRPDDMQITNTTDQALYRSEHYGMTLFTNAVPNGKYTVKLHFCETYDGITGEGQRVFSFNVQGHEFKDFDVYKVAGGPQTAYIVTVPIEVTNGMVNITFTPNQENPQINAIEIIPSS